MGRSNLQALLFKSSITEALLLRKKDFPRPGICLPGFRLVSTWYLIPQAPRNIFGFSQKFCLVEQHRQYSNAPSIKQAVNVSYHSGLPVISVPLPSREELCQFTLRPVSSTVGDFLNGLKEEDRGVDRAHVYTTDGCRIASNTRIEHLLKSKFVLTVNEKSYEVDPPVLDYLSSEGLETFDHVKALISQLYSHLHVDQHQLAREQELLGRLERLKEEQKPLLELKESAAQNASRRTRILIWGGLAGMATQFGILARLTWWEYSWDIMEPVTYFITYGTAIVMYGYFVLTQQEYIYPDARDRQYLNFLYRAAKNTEFDVKRYNQLCDEIAQAEQDLKRLRDPLQLQLPTEPIRAKEVDGSSQP